MKAVYDILRSLNEIFPYLMIGVFALAFMFAFAMMFMIPPVSLLVLFGALYTLGIAVVFWKLMKLLELKVAVHMLDRGTCPNCGHESNEKFISPCSSCLTNYQSHPAAGVANSSLETESESGSDHDGVVHF